MCSRNAPRRTVAPRASRAFANASTRSSAISGGAAPSHEGRRNDQDLAPDVRQRAVHLAVLVLEHPEVEDLLGQPVVLAEPVVGAHADEKEEAGSDLGQELVADRDRCSVDALEQDPQRGTTRNAS
jgi:hypothetical protein